MTYLHLPRALLSLQLRPLMVGGKRQASSEAHIKQPIPKGQSHQRFREFDLQGKVFAVTGAGRGLGLTMAEALVEAGGEVHCLDLLPKPHEDFHEAKARANPDFGGALYYQRMDVRDRQDSQEIMSSIASGKDRLDGVIASAGVNHVCDAMDHTPEDIDRVIDINYKGVFTTATAAAHQMLERKTRGSILLVASMSGLIANKKMNASIYNSSKAAVIQLGRSLAMEWAPIDTQRRGGIRVNSLCPGHIVTPMVQKIIDQETGTKEVWESENMLGRLARAEEFRGLALFLMSDASSFMTGSSIVCDGGHTAW
ncbi:hypothetical protein FE257_012402 [Aspergillus nanangensis]|uniref:Uncharacterized protein n=1 Tax=Aspergillus nanangensis TaxID=2582783 RepID=A0AAD4GXL0_ASPNN|nr:hypothetical protein FE257_012402 [Aspergillus nanangensis]